jgi:hypothetical protein
MRRELLVRCLAVGTLRTEASDGAWCELREVWLHVAESAACVRTMECCEDGRYQVTRTIEFAETTVRHRPGERAPLDWLASLAASMEEGEYSVVPVWVSPTRPDALLLATPVDPRFLESARLESHASTAYEARERPVLPVRVRAVPATL